MSLTIQADLMEETELELTRLIWRQHNAGLNFWELMKIFLDYTQKLAMQSEGEYAQKEEVK